MPPFPLLLKEDNPHYVTSVIFKVKSFSIRTVEDPGDA